jgi:hypothetical protein
MYYAGGDLDIPYIRILCRIACARVNARTLGTHGLVGLSSIAVQQVDLPNNDKSRS